MEQKIIQVKTLSLPAWNKPRDLEEATLRIFNLGKNMHEHAYLVGKDLIWVRDQTGTTEFEKEDGWIDKNVWFCVRTAYHFMAFAKKCDWKKELLDYHGRPRLTTATVAVALPKGKYKTIVVDPPWPIEKIERYERPLQEKQLDYPTLSIEEIERIPIRDLFDEGAGCHIYLWTTERFLKSGEAGEVLKSWGVKFRNHLIWHKNVGFTPFGIGFQINHEFILFGTVGKLDLLERGCQTVFTGKVREHSRKPDEFYELVKKVSPAPRIDVFSREKREGFDQYGNETNKFLKINA